MNAAWLERRIEPLQRKPISPDWQRYEQEKQAWLAKHPTATQEAYDRAVRAIARRFVV